MGSIRISSKEAGKLLVDTSIDGAPIDFGELEFWVTIPLEGLGSLDKPSHYQLNCRLKKR